MIYSSQKSQVNKIGDNCIFVDVGGGSTEITVFAKGEPSAAQSFDIGTIRILEDQVSRNNWKEMKDWLQEHTDRLKTFSLIGSGGNINRISKMAELKAGKFMTFDQLKDILDEIKLYSIDDRIKLLDLNPDRADVIVPAGEIFINVMKWTETKKIFVPKIGLGDGIVREVYKEYSRGKRLTSFR